MTDLYPSQPNTQQLAWMQQTLDSYERRYRMLYEATPAMLHSIDSQGRLLHVSDLWLATLGYARDEVIGCFWADFLTPASRAYAAGTVIPELFRTGHYKGVEYQAVHKDGTHIDIVASSFIQRDPDGSPLLSLTVIEDVTERKRVQTELAEQIERLHVTLHAIGEGVITTDAQGRVEYLNPVAEKLTGWTTAAARHHLRLAGRCIDTRTYTEPNQRAWLPYPSVRGGWRTILSNSSARRLLTVLMTDSNFLRTRNAMTTTIAKARKSQEADLLPGRRSAQKRSNLLATASELFLAKGYDGVSLDEIIAAVGGSKTTIYSYFKGKEGVFVAAVSALCDETVAKVFRIKASSMPLREALQTVGQALLDAVLSPRAVALQRLVLAEAHRFPEVGRIWFERGPAQAHQLLTDFFEERQRIGEIGSVDPHKIAVLFHDMLTYEIHQQVSLGIIAKPKRAVLADKVSSAIEVLLNGCKAI